MSRTDKDQPRRLPSDMLRRQRRQSASKWFPMLWGHSPDPQARRQAEDSARARLREALQRTRSMDADDVDVEPTRHRHSAWHDSI